MKKIIGVFCIIIIILVSCFVDSHYQEMGPCENAIDNASVIEYFLQMGYNKEDIEINNEFIIIEGDMLYYLKNVIQQINACNRGYQTPILVDPNQIQNIVVKIDQNVPAEWTQQINNAMTTYNAIEGTDLNFVAYNPAVHNPGDVDITVTYSNLNNNNIIAQAVIPIDTDPNDQINQGYIGIPGNSIVINSGFQPTTPADTPVMTPAEIYKTSLHELGHTIGLHHPGSGTHIPDTAVYDPAHPETYISIMFQGEFPATGLSFDDILSIQKIYSNSPTPTPTPVSTQTPTPVSTSAPTLTPVP